VLRRREAFGQRTFRERLEICNAGVAPPLRFVLLYLQERRHLRMSLGIYEWSEALPFGAQFTDRLDTVGVSIHQLIPKDAARPGAIVPRQVMEPQQELLGHTLHVTKLRRDRRRVLSHRVAARLGAIEADAFLVGAMEINRRPIGTRAALDPRPRAIVVTAAHEVMQT